MTPPTVGRAGKDAVAHPPQGVASLLDRLTKRDQRTVAQIGRLTRLHALLVGERRRLNSGEAEAVVEARLTAWGIRL